MDDFIPQRFETLSEDDPLRIFHIWKRHSDNIVSWGYVAITGFPAKQIEEYPALIHRVSFTADQLRPHSN
jgi:hypothetical protein